MNDEATLHNTLMGYLDSKCIKCHASVNTEIDDFTLYQVKEGQRYLYCDDCDSPSKPLTTQGDIDIRENQIKMYQENKKNMEKFCFYIAVISLAIGWLLAKYL